MSAVDTVSLRLRGTCRKWMWSSVLYSCLRPDSFFFSSSISCSRRSIKASDWLKAAFSLIPISLLTSDLILSMERIISSNIFWLSTMALWAEFWAKQAGCHRFTAWSSSAWTKQSWETDLALCRNWSGCWGLTLRESTAVLSSSSSFTLSWHFCLISAWETPKSFCRIKEYYRDMRFNNFPTVCAHAGS